MLHLLVFVAGAVLLCYGIYRWAINNNDYFSKRNLPYIKPYFLVGNFGGFIAKQHTMYDYVKYIYNLFPIEKIVGIFVFKDPVYILRDPEVIKQVVVKDFDHFQDHRPFIDEKIDVLFGNSLFMMQGDKWRDMRATLSPAFTGSKMRKMFDLVNNCGHAMAEYFRKEAASGQRQDHEMKELFQRYASDVIASAAFGITVNSFENKENYFYSTGKKLFQFTTFWAFIKMVLAGMIPRITRALGMSVVDVNASKYFQSLVLDAIDHRQKNKIYRPDMINILMKLKAGRAVSSQSPVPEMELKEYNGFATVEESSVGRVEVKRQWNDTELVAQSFLFFLAGFDTSSTALSFTAHELTVNPDVQDKLYAEILATNAKLNGAKLTYEELQKMRYMDMVVSEALRFWTPVALVDRICTKDYEYNDGRMKFKIEKGVTIWIPVYGMHHDPKYFPNPSKFDPERFNEENRATITPGTYLPFGIGPRNCIGSRFALMEVKAVLYYLLLNFKFEPNADSQIPLKIKKGPGSILTEKGINLRFTPR